MAWTCVRCERKIYSPRPGAIRFALEWKYTKKDDSLSIDVKNLRSIKESSTVTHLSCSEHEVEGFKDRMRSMLNMPENRDHPMLI